MSEKWFQFEGNFSISQIGEAVVFEHSDVQVEFPVTPRIGNVLLVRENRVTPQWSFWVPRYSQIVVENSVQEVVILTSPTHVQVGVAIDLCEVRYWHLNYSAEISFVPQSKVELFFNFIK